MLVRCLRKIPRVASLPTTSYSTEAATDNLPRTGAPLVPPTDYRINELNVNEHTNLHLGKFYTIPAEQKKQMFQHGGFPKKFEMQVKTFTESCLMIRKPALELIEYIRNTDFTRPTVRYVIYGENGTGKTLTMAHVLHYGLENNFLLVHVPWAPNWMKRPKESSNSATQEGHIDLPFDAAAWLVHFKTQNSKLLNTLQLKTSRDYVWSKREVTAAGSTLLDLVEHGIARIKFATDTIAALMGEIKEHASAGHCKVMVAIDGYNAFFHPVTRILTDNKVRVTPDKVTLTKPFLDITNYDWTNGVCILSVDKIAMTEGYMDSYMPRYLLGEHGFEHLDPFVPIRLDNYNEKEFANCINYYLDRRWIQKTEEDFDEQLKHLSARNPYMLMRLTRSL